MRCFVMSPSQQDFSAIEIDFLADDALAIDLYLAELRRLRQPETLSKSKGKRSGSPWRWLVNKVNALGMPPAHQLDIY